jgi:hypothetical protein
MGVTYAHAAVPFTCSPLVIVMVVVGDGGQRGGREGRPPLVALALHEGPGQVGSTSGPHRSGELRTTTRDRNAETDEQNQLVGDNARSASRSKWTSTLWRS